MEKGRERLTFGKIKIECRPFDKIQNLCSITLHDIIKKIRKYEQLIWFVLSNIINVKRGKYKGIHDSEPSSRKMEYFTKKSSNSLFTK